MKTEDKVMWVVTFFGGWGFYLVVTDRVERAIALAKKDMETRTQCNPRVEKVERHRYCIIIDE